ncbi:MAG: GNAT family N-acetyltransferase [Acidimicrobiales bacterium]
MSRLDLATHRERAVYEEHSPARNRTIWVRPVDVTHDTGLVHLWMHKPHVEEYWAMAWPPEEIAAYLRRHDDEPTRSSYVGCVDDDAVGYLEVYDPAHDVLGGHYPVQAGDVGAHVLIGSEDYLGRYSVSLGRSVTRFLFQDPRVRRIVGEPDVRNHNFVSLLAFLGYRKEGELDLPDKRAALMVCERDVFERLGTRRRRPPGGG